MSYAGITKFRPKLPKPGKWASAAELRKYHASEADYMKPSVLKRPPVIMPVHRPDTPPWLIAAALIVAAFVVLGVWKAAELVMGQP